MKRRRRGLLKERKDFTCTCNMYFLHPRVDDGHVTSPSTSSRTSLVFTAVAADAWQGLDLTAALDCRPYQALQSNLQPAQLLTSLVIHFSFSVSQVLMLEKILVFSVILDLT